MLPLADALELLECPRVSEELPGEPPDLLGGALQRGGGLAPEQVQVGQEVVGAALAQEAGHQLQK